MNALRPFSIASGGAAYSIDSAVANAAAPGRYAGTASGMANADTRRKFEAMTLSVMIGSMLPQRVKGPFGAGSAGEMWKSLFAREIANVLSADGRLKLLPEAPDGGARLQNATSVRRISEGGGRGLEERAPAFNSQSSAAIGEWLTTTNR